jgi:hypothetical protein
MLLWSTKLLNLSIICSFLLVSGIPCVGVPFYLTIHPLKDISVVANFYLLQISLKHCCIVFSVEKISLGSIPRSPNAGLYDIVCLGFSSVLGFELRAFYLLGGCYLSHIPQPFFFSYVLNRGSCLCLGRPLQQYSYLHFSCNRDTSSCHHA